MVDKKREIVILSLKKDHAIELNNFLKEYAEHSQFGLGPTIVKISKRIDKALKKIEEKKFAEECLLESREEERDRIKKGMTIPEYEQYMKDQEQAAEDDAEQAEEVEGPEIEEEPDDSNKTMPDPNSQEGRY